MENGNNKYINQLAGSEDIGGYAVWGLARVIIGKIQSAFVLV